MNNCLSPHHGMCFQFYEGKGYSADFTDHMGRVIKELEADPEQKVVLKAETDIVCENCPNNVIIKYRLNLNGERLCRGKYPVITLCGSTRFKDQFMEAQNLAVNRLFKKDDTDQSADFISIVAFKNQADFLEKFGKKGVKLLITGRIQTGSYDKGGTRIYTTDVIAEQLEFAESKSSGETSESAPESGDGWE